MTALIYVVGQVSNRGDKDAEPPQMKAVKAYASSRGWPDLKSEQYVQVSKPGEHLKETMAMLSGGDTLLIANVQSLAERPSEQEKAIRDCLGRGVHVHCLDPLGDITGFLPGMFAVWDAAADVERELDQALADMGQMEERHAQDLKDFEGSLLDRIRAEGLTIQVGKATNGNGYANQSLGDEIKSARSKRNLSQRELGDLAGISHSQVGRIEQYGRGDGIEAVMKALGMEDQHAADTSA